MRSRIFSIISLSCLMLVTAGCGGGSNSSQSASSQRKMSSSVRLPISSTQAIGGLQLTVHFPLGVTVTTDDAGKPVVAEVAQIVGAPDHANVQCLLSYLAATEAAGGELRLVIADPAGFVEGESVSIQMNITTGFNPDVGAFTISDLVVSDLDGNTVAGLTPTFTVETF